LINTFRGQLYPNPRNNLDKKIEKAEINNCFVSEITIAELKFGAENSEKQEKNRNPLTNL
jgi:tRNA(fMet)-specific endonuclease VapC